MLTLLDRNGFTELLDFSKNPAPLEECKDKAVLLTLSDFHKMENICKQTMLRKRVGGAYHSWLTFKSESAGLFAVHFVTLNREVDNCCCKCRSSRVSVVVSLSEYCETMCSSCANSARLGERLLE